VWSVSDAEDFWKAIVSDRNKEIEELTHKLQIAEKWNRNYEIKIDELMERIKRYDDILNNDPKVEELRNKWKREEKELHGKVEYRMEKICSLANKPTLSPTDWLDYK
jgi:predicted  nucleic acid-binding Zn-ribbon protein